MFSVACVSSVISGPKPRSQSEVVTEIRTFKKYIHISVLGNIPLWAVGVINPGMHAIPWPPGPSHS